MKTYQKTILVATLLSLIITLNSCQKKSIPDPTGGIAKVDSVASYDGVVIYFETIGAGSPALVFVHGWSSNRSIWEEQVSYFADKFTVVTIDLAGHGQSGTNRTEWTLEALGEDVAAVVNKLNIEKAILVGHSMGGWVNVEAAHRLPGRVLGLVGVDNYVNITHEYPVSEIEEYLAPFEENFAAAKADLIREMIAEDADSATINKITSAFSPVAPEIAIALLRNMYIDYHLAERVKTLNLPITAINTDIWPTNVKGNQEVATSFEAIIIPGLGHFVHMEDPETFNEHLLSVTQNWAAFADIGEEE